MLVGVSSYPSIRFSTLQPNAVTSNLTASKIMKHVGSLAGEQLAVMAGQLGQRYDPRPSTSVILLKVRPR
jgi:hypothetical protein